MSIPSFIQMGLAVIFGLTGLLKLYTPSSMKSTLAAIGIPKPLSAVGAWLVPLLEVATAACFLWSATVRIGEILAFGLIGGFGYAIAVALRKGERIRCNCFGKLREEYLGRGTLLRIVLLTIMNSYLTIADDPASFADVAWEELAMYVVSWAGLIGLYLIVPYVIRAISTPQTD